MTEKFEEQFAVAHQISSQPVRALCVHGHFYQPPRENPLTGKIPQEVGAAPFPNWNARIHAECYQPNAALGNFERISFNVGPTLFDWMASHDPVTYHRIIAQDRSNLERFGVGSAMAQAYNHTILPLANRQDKITQITWGLADFEYRFKRKAQGMWLPETAVDLETLDIMAELGITYTILAPWQAADPHLDPTEPYWVDLPSGRRIIVFFYQQELSGGVSFNQGMTANAHDFALNDLSPYFSDQKSQRGESQILIVASDGELYGHHQHFRDWFLAYLVNGAGAQAGIQLTFPARWLQTHPPTKTVQLNEYTSWSCYHGVDRWQKGCDCTAGSGVWKAKLRTAFDRLADQLDQIYVETISGYGLDPWRLRNDYIQVCLGAIEFDQIVNQPGSRVTAEDDFLKICLLLQSQRERQRMYTSCGWFFDNFDRIEPRNNIAYAAKAIILTYLATENDCSAQILADLAEVEGIYSDETGADVFDTYWQLEFEWADEVLCPSFS